MIVAKELRLGNKIRRKSTGAICTVNWGIIRDFETGTDVKDYEGILLMPALLLSYGFKHKHFDINQYEEEERYTLEIGEDNKYAVCFVSETYGGKPHKYIRLRRDDDILYPVNFDYFHQMQNIMFDLSTYEFSV